MSSLTREPHHRFATRAAIGALLAGGDAFVTRRLEGTNINGMVLAEGNRLATFVEALGGSYEALSFSATAVAIGAAYLIHRYTLSKHHAALESTSGETLVDVHNIARAAMIVAWTYLGHVRHLFFGG